MEKNVLYDMIIKELSKVIDPETGVDVIKMQLVQEIIIDSHGKVSYTFRPSSPLCPIAVPLAVMIIKVIGEVEGVSGQSITVKDYIEADKLNEILNSVLED